MAVPYKSSNEMMLSVAGGNTLFSIADRPPTVPLVQGGKIRALAVTGSQRFERAARGAEHGRGGISRDQYRAVERTVYPWARRPRSSRRSTRPCILRWRTRVRDKLKAMATNPGGGPGEEFRNRIESDIRMFADVVKART